MKKKLLLDTSPSRTFKFLGILLFIFTINVKSYALNVTYYVNAATGNDSKNGTTLANAWATLNRANTQNLGPGDKILLNSDGPRHNGNLYMNVNDIGTAANPIIVGSYGTKPRAVVYSGSNSGFVSNVSGIRVQNLEFYGARMYGSANAKEGINFYRDGTNSYASYIYIDNCKLEGYGKSGIFIYAYCETSSMTRGFSDITIKNTSVYDCGNSGVQIYAYGSGAGIYANTFNVFSNILIDNVRASNNKGDATVTSYATGNGILISSANNVTVQNCVADKNGINNRHKGAGVAGIWFYEVNNGSIQNCEAFDNYGSMETDGNGFGIDGGCQNCVIQYCYSHNNEGGGYGVFDFENSFNVHQNNTIRYNISQNDGRKNGVGGICLWSANNGGDRINNLNVYNNTIYLDANNLIPITVAANGYSVGQTILPCGVRVLHSMSGSMNNVKFYNNVFYLDDANANLPFVKAEDYGFNSVNIPPANILFLNNLYYKASNPKFNWGSSYTSLTNWNNGTSQEKNGTTNYGITSNPNLTAPGTGGTLAGAITGSAPVNVPLGINLTSLSAYRISASNDLALNLTGNTPFPIGLNIGTRDYYGNVLNVGAPYDVGANEFAASLPVNDTQAPTVPSNLTSSNITSSSLTLSWTASTDNVGVTAYEVFRGGVSQGTVTGTSYNATGLTASTAYSFTVRARDAANNNSAQNGALSVTTSAPTGDTQAPTVPTNLTSSNVTFSSLTLSWTASTDNVGVTAYEVFRGGVSQGTVTGTSYNATGLTASTAYSFTVRARDAANNNSAQSSSLSITTAPSFFAGNMGFESDFTSWSTYGTASVNTVGSNVNSGSKSGYFSNGGGNLVVSGLTPGRTYTLKGWVKAVSGLDIWITASNYGGANIGQQMTSTSWTQSGNIVFTMGTTNTSVTLATWTGATSSAYFDDYTLSTYVAGQMNAGREVVLENTSSIVEVYPNPASGSFSVSSADNAKIIVTSLDGRVIKTVNASGRVTTIDSGNWSSGMYIIQVQSASGSTVKKLMISK